MKNIITFVCVFAAVVHCVALSHAEHDKARYVSVDGVDIGRCGKAKEPCKTISYASQNANKGDNIRVSEGSYQINDTDTLFYLLSEILPIRGGFSLKDDFKKKNDNYITRLIGVPLEYAALLGDKGFTVIVDTKGQSPELKAELSEKLQMFERLKEAQPRFDCVGGFASDYACNNIDLLAHIPLSSFSTNPVDANDIWGHFDLNDKNEYALIGLSNGIGIVNVSKPEDPQVVTTISSQSTIWRDLKVYQFFDSASQRWKSYAYVTADSASVGLMIIDLTDLPNTATVASVDTTDLSAHNVYLSNVDYSTGVALTDLSPYLHIAGSNRNGGAFNSYSLSEPTSPTSIYKPVDSNRSNYSHDVSSMVITDERKDTQCINGTNHCEIFFDFNENNFKLWDKTDNTDPQELSSKSYTNANYVHSGWFTEDKLVVIVHDELDEINAGLNTTVRFFDMSDLTSPEQIATWTGPTRAIDHNGFVRGNRYYMSNYERGLTVLDITDPAAPEEVGFFDTYPVNNSASFNGAWGVYPFLPSGNLLISDINSGLYILKDRTTTSVNGSARFSVTNYLVDEGEVATVEVSRNDGSSGIVQVAWELATGAADKDDFVMDSGILQWADGESEIKSIQVVTNTDNNSEPSEIFFIRLFDPRNGLTISSPNIATITLAVENRPPTLSAGEDMDANVGDTVDLNGTANDPDGDALVYSWIQNSGPNISIINSDSLSASFVANEIGSYIFNLSATDTKSNTNSDTVSVVVSQQNSAPNVTATANNVGTVGDMVTLVATAIDAESNSMTFNWAQILGTTIALSNNNMLEATLTPTVSGSYSFVFTATDSLGFSTEAVVNFSVSEPAVSSGGGSNSWGLLSLLVLILRIKKKRFN